MITRRDFLGVLTAGALVPSLVGCARAAEPLTAQPIVGLSIGTYGMKDLTTLEALRLIRETGYDGVQVALLPGWATDPAKLLADDRRTLRQQLTDSGLALPSMLDHIPLLGTAEAKTKSLDRLKRAVELGNDLVPGRPPYLDTILGGKKAAWENISQEMVDQLRTWVPVLESSNTTLTFKPHAGDAVQSPERALWLVKAVDSPRIRITFDYSHYHVEGFQLEDSLRQLIPMAPVIVVKDSAGPADKPTFLLPGDGTTDYLAYFRLLRQLGYAGFVNIEVSSMVHRKPGYQPVPTVRLCYERLAPLLAQAGFVRPKRQG